MTRGQILHFRASDHEATLIRACCRIESKSLSQVMREAVMARALDTIEGGSHGGEAGTGLCCKAAEVP